MDLLNAWKEVFLICLLGLLIFGVPAVVIGGIGYGIGKIIAYFTTQKRLK